MALIEFNGMGVWDQVKSTPDYAKKPIQGGRLNGFTDINPMWRLKRLTEIFGPVGTGWKYTVVNQQVFPGASGEAIATVEIQLAYKKNDGEWSDPIPGLGGSMLIATEKGSLKSNDEAFKMALSDAIGTACKALGMSEDVYFSGKGRSGSKYQGEAPQEPTPARKMTKEEAAAFVLTFGKHQGQTLREVFNTDKGYLKELLEGKVDRSVKEAVATLLRAVQNAG